MAAAVVRRRATTLADRIARDARPRPDPPGASAAARGAAFEARAAGAVRETLGFEAARTGRAYDRGVDLRGTWRGVPVVVQCKHEAKPCGARHLREMHGVLAAERAGTLGVFVSSAGVTREALRFFSAMAEPCAVCTVSAEGGGGGGRPPGLQSLRLNAAAKRLLPSLVIGKRYLAGGGSVVEPVWIAGDRAPCAAK